MRRAPVLLLLALAACGGPEAPAPGDVASRRPVVYAVNYPLAYFAQRIAGGTVTVAFPVPAGADPAFWRPSDDAIAAFQSADLILLNGAGYARWTARASLPPSRCVDTSAAFADRLLRVEEAVTHSHGPAGAHEHGGVAFTTWLDLSLAQEQAKAVRDALTGMAPRARAAFEKGYESLAGELAALDAAMAAAAPRTPGVASHPVYQYWARRYGVRLVSVHFEPDEVPGAEGWAELDRLLVDHPARWMVWEAEPLPETVAGLRDRGLRCVVVAPCGNAPEEGDFLAVMRRNVARLREAFAR